MKHIVLSIVALTLTVHANAGIEAWLQSGLIKPEVIQQIKPELNLTPEQESKMANAITEARVKGEPLEQTLKAQQQALHDLLRQADSTVDEATAQLTKTLETEAAIKQLQLRTLLTLRSLLTPEQQKIAQKLSAPKAIASSNLESQVKEKAERLRAAVDSLGEKPTEAMKSRGAKIEALIKSNDLVAADAELDRLITDSGINETLNNEDAPDFNKSEPGNTDLDALKQRFEAVKEGAQGIVSIPQMRRFLKAKEAFESAKAAEDAVAVGRVLTWAERELEKK